MIRYRPKGSMCAACDKRLENCSSLPFSSMRPIGKDSDGAVIVKCSGFTVANKDHNK